MLLWYGNSQELFQRILQPLTSYCGLQDILDRKLHRHNHRCVLLPKYCFRLIIRTRTGAATHTIGSHSAPPNTATFFQNETQKAVLLHKVSLRMISSICDNVRMLEDTLPQVSKRRFGIVWPRMYDPKFISTRHVNNSKNSSVSLSIGSCACARQGLLRFNGILLPH